MTQTDTPSSSLFWEDTFVQQLANAMEKGYALCPYQVVESYGTRIAGEYGFCAVGMIALGLRGKLPEDPLNFDPQHYSLSAVRILLGRQSDIMDLWGLDVQTPSGTADDTTLSNALFFLNDTYKWSIPEIVGWLRSLRYDAETHSMKITIKE